jgi:hypothetical protein
MSSSLTNTLILIILFTIISSNQNIYRDLRLTTIPCFQETCNIYGGECLGDGIGKTCICKSGYTSFPDDSTIKCNYQKYLQETAFLYEAIFPFGVGHFYARRYRFGIFKSIFYFIGYLLIFMVRILSKPKEEYSVTVISISAASFIFLLGMFVWTGIDLFNFGLNKYLDGNDIVLLPWGEDPNNILRLVFG